MRASSFLIFPALLSAFAAHAGEPSDEKLRAAANSQRWHRLLHYRKSFPFSGFKSEADGDGFFLSPSGRTDPEAELRANLAAMTESREIGLLKQHPQCAFPERYRFLKEELGFAAPDQPCPKLDEFLARFNAGSASLVFSSAFPNNPSSMFGHTLLKIKAKTDSGKPRSDLLDKGLNYAAAVPKDENGFAFAWFGLMGGYPGRFSMQPYYDKVNEYNNSESRDLWEYELSLNEDEVIRLLRHAWEIETNTHFDYYFFDENCSYLILTLLEVARPDWKLSEFGVHAIPLETVRRVAETPGAIRDIRFRPSLRKRTYTAFELLSSDARSQLAALMEENVSLQRISDPATLDALAIYLQYVRQKNGGKLEPEGSQLLHQALVRRSQLPQSAESPAISAGSRPDTGHPPYRLGARGGWDFHRASAFQELSFKFAYHDLLSDDQGYIPFSQIDFPNLTVRHSSGRFTLQKLELIGITSLFPLTFLEKSLSWRAAVDFRVPKDRDCEGCIVLHGEVGFGPSVNLGSHSNLMYFLPMLSVEAGAGLGSAARFLPGARVGLLSQVAPGWKSSLSASALTDLFQSHRQLLLFGVELEQAFHLSPYWEVRGGASTLVPGGRLNQRRSEAQVALHRYF